MSISWSGKNSAKPPLSLAFAPPSHLKSCVGDAAPDEAPMPPGLTRVIPPNGVDGGDVDEPCDEVSTVSAAAAARAWICGGKRGQISAAVMTVSEPLICLPVSIDPPIVHVAVLKHFLHLHSALHSAQQLLEAWRPFFWPSPVKAAHEAVLETSCRKAPPGLPVTSASSATLEQQIYPNCDRSSWRSTDRDRSTGPYASVAPARGSYMYISIT